jgi:hypothetical protein
MRKKVEKVGEVVLNFISAVRPVVVGALVVTGSLVILSITLSVVF